MKFALLSLLDSGPGHGYELKLRLERALGAAAPEYNIGQVYTTLARLERDGLVEGAEEADGPRQRRTFAITADGRATLGEWLETPGGEESLARDEFHLKVVLTAQLRPEALRSLIQRERTARLDLLRGLQPSQATDRASGLLQEAVALHAEADLAWLEACETSISKWGEDLWNPALQAATSRASTISATSPSTRWTVSTSRFGEASSSP